MPLARISLFKGRSPETLRAIADRIVFDAGVSAGIASYFPA
jgi:hypothetical protein